MKCPLLELNVAVNKLSGFAAVGAAKNGYVEEFDDKYVKGQPAPDNGNFIRINYDDGAQGVFIHLKSVEKDLKKRG